MVEADVEDVTGIYEAAQNLQMCRVHGQRHSSNSRIR